MYKQCKNLYQNSFLKLRLPLSVQSSIKNNCILFIKRNITILGIETSCDDTGCAIVNDKGHILGESLYSQQEIHLE